MKRFAALLTLSVAILLFAPVGHAARFTGNLSGPAESPPNTSTATGFAAVELDTERHTMRVSVSFSGLSTPTVMAHIHCCVAPNGTAGVATAVPAFAGFPLGVTGGSFDAVFDTTQASTWNAPFIAANGGTPAGAEARLASGLAAGQAYQNVHTTAIPGGEIRGFLVPQVDIPVFSGWTLGMVAAVLALLGFAALRKRAA